MPFYFKSEEKGSREKVNYVEKIANGEKIDFSSLDEESLNDLVEDIFAAAAKETNKTKLGLYLGALEHIRLKIELDPLQKTKMQELDRRVSGAEKPVNPFNGMHEPRDPNPKPAEEAKPIAYDAFDLFEEIEAKSKVAYENVPAKILLRVTDLIINKANEINDYGELIYLMGELEKIKNALNTKGSRFRADQENKIHTINEKIADDEEEMFGPPAADPDEEEEMSGPLPTPRFEPEDETDRFTTILREIYDDRTGEFKIDRLTELEIIELLDLIVNKNVIFEADCVYLYNLAEKIVDYLSEKGIAIPEHTNDKYNVLVEKYMSFRHPAEEEAEEEEVEEEEEDKGKKGRKKGKKDKKSHKGIKITCIGVALVTLAVGGHHLASVLNHKSPYLFKHGKTYTTAEQVNALYNGDASDISTLTNENRVRVSADVWDDEAMLGVMHNHVSEHLEVLEYDIYEHTDSIIPDYDTVVSDLMEVILGGAPVEYRGNSVCFDDLSPEGKEHILSMVLNVKKYYRSGASYTQQDIDDMVAQARLNMSKSK